MSKNKANKWKNDFDVVEIDHWECPNVNDTSILAMPNIPYPLHSLAPRTVLGATTWNFMRKACYKKAGKTCEICGYKPSGVDGDYCHAHEVYDIDYARQQAEFKRTICLCKRCHLMCIHTGRALTLYKQGNPMYTKERLLVGAEHAFTIINNWNKEHPEEEPLRVFSAWLDYMKQPDLKEPMKELIEKYNIKFYSVNEKWYNRDNWTKWKLMVGNKWYETPYENREAWELAMTEKSKDPHDDHNFKGSFVGGVYDELDKFLSEKNK